MNLDEPVAERGGVAEQRYVCLTCPEPIFAAEIDGTAFRPGSARHLIYFWMERLDKGMGRVFREFALGAPVLLFVAAIVLLAMGFDSMVGFTLALAVLSFALLNYTPLVSLPLGPHNAVTNSDSPTAGANYALVKVVLFAVVGALLLEILGVLRDDTPSSTFQPPRLVSRAVSTLLLVGPVVFLAYLAVTDLYLAVPMYSPINPLYAPPGKPSNFEQVAALMRKIPNKAQILKAGGTEGDANDAERMRRVWQNRGGFYQVRS
mmetsp:Transcript_18678/g.34599  ORF Transcript_18678/g.34599 Transcript_18678/m.34599 type:complete len:262 (-) Transcript_18678:21-806(-)